MGNANVTNTATVRMILHTLRNAYAELEKSGVVVDVEQADLRQAAVTWLLRGGSGKMSPDWLQIFFSYAAHFPLICVTWPFDIYSQTAHLLSMQ